ncbi:hypothetical protein FACS1894190_00630 [Spirochaetia bacterium]|nr:hypothetical protein FACS1894190_00630 [Spirochaetia bacterium]
MAAIFGRSEEEIIAIADELAQQCDNNAPQKTSSYEGLFSMVEDGLSEIEQDKVFMDFMDITKEQE